MNNATHTIDDLEPGTIGGRGYYVTNHKNPFLMYSAYARHSIRFHWLYNDGTNGEPPNAVAIVHPVSNGNTDPDNTEPTLITEGDVIYIDDRYLVAIDDSRIGYPHLVTGHQYDIRIKLRALQRQHQAILNDYYRTERRDKNLKESAEELHDQMEHLRRQLR